MGIINDEMRPYLKDYKCTMCGKDAVAFWKEHGELALCGDKECIYKVMTTVAESIDGRQLITVRK